MLVFSQCWLHLYLLLSSQKVKPPNPSTLSLKRNLYSKEMDWVGLFVMFLLGVLSVLATLIFIIVETKVNVDDVVCLFSTSFDHRKTLSALQTKQNPKHLSFLSSNISIQMKWIGWVKSKVQFILLPTCTIWLQNRIMYQGFISLSIIFKRNGLGGLNLSLNSSFQNQMYLKT